MERLCQSPFRLNLRNRDSFRRFDQSCRFFDETTFNIDVSVIETRNSSEKYVDLPCARDVCKKERKKERRSGMGRKNMLARIEFIIPLSSYFWITKI